MIYFTRYTRMLWMALDMDGCDGWMHGWNGCNGWMDAMDGCMDGMDAMDGYMDG